MNNLKKHANKGFSLVELIVVIAIMAILVGVAVPVYAQYIDKTNRAKDIQLVDEITHSVEIAAAADNWMQYKNSEGDTYIGTVVLKSDGTTATINSSLTGKVSLDAILKDTFGADYETKIKRSWDGWKGTSSANAQLIISSAFQGNQGELLSQIQDLTDEVKTFVTLNSDEGTMNLVFAGVGMTDEWMVKNGFDPSNSQERANAVTYFIAEKVSECDQTSFSQSWDDLDVLLNEDGYAPNMPNDDLTMLAIRYAKLQEYKCICGACPTLSAIFEAPENQINGNSVSSIRASFNRLHTAVMRHVDPAKVGIQNASGCPTCGDLLDAFDEQGGVGGGDAFYTLMNQIVSAGDVIKADKTNSSLYTSDGVTSYVNSYMEMAELLQEAGVGDNDIAISFALTSSGLLKIYTSPVGILGD